MRRLWNRRTLGLLAGTMISAAVWANSPPVAVDDAVQLPIHGLQVVADVLANDLEPDGELLRISSASDCIRVAGSAVVVGTTTETSDGYFISFTASQPLQDGEGGGLSEECQVTYTVDDEDSGTASDTGTLTVRPAATLIFRDGFETGDTGEWS